jgi:hypothetical protein
MVLYQPGNIRIVFNHENGSLHKRILARAPPMKPFSCVNFGHFCVNSL